MLTLPIKKQWFDMILQRIKLEEYRELNDYYSSRFKEHENQIMTIALRNGYSSLSHLMVVDVIPVQRVGGKAEWGADENTNYWVLQIASIHYTYNVSK